MPELDKDLSITKKIGRGIPQPMDVLSNPQGVIRLRWGLGLSLNGYLDGGLDGLVALDGAFVLAYGLDLTEGDVLLVYINTSGLESLLDLAVVTEP